MKSTIRKIRSSPYGVPVTIGSAIALAVCGGAVAAQTATGQSSTQQRSGRVQQQNTTASTATLSTVIATMAQSAGVQILADRAVANYEVAAPATTTTTANIDEQIKALVAQLPSGAVSGKFYLPAASTQAYTADNVEQFAMAESRLFGPVGGPQVTGTIEVLGQKLSSDKATVVIADLNLQAIYLIGNPSASQSSQQSRQGQGGYNNSSAPQNGTTSANGTLTSQAQTLLSMSAGERDPALLQMASDNQQTISQVLQNVPASERQQLLQSLRGISGSSGGSGGGGFGRRGGGGQGGGPPGGSN